MGEGEKFFSREKNFSPSPISQRLSNKKDAEAAVPGRNFDAASAGVWGLHYESLRLHFLM